jgi:2-polyprenyl-6-methoxyphenol hydroxylase-like FAD-dependent oxidoreductase
MTGRSSPQAVVIGGSISGLLAALLLRHGGWAVDIYERVQGDLAGRGAGIVTHAPLWQVLDMLGIAWRDRLGIEVATRRMFAPDGTLEAEAACPQTLSAWDRVYSLLRTAFPASHYHQGKELLRVEQDRAGIAAVFADGTRVGGDLLLGCDGLRSTVRGQFLPEVRPLYAGYVAWRGLVPESALPPDLHAAIFMHLAFCLPPGEQMLGYPVAGPHNDLRPGHRRYNLVWYRPAGPRQLAHVLTDEGGTVHAISIPPPAVSDAAIVDMRAAAERVLSPQFQACWHASLRPFVQPIYDVQSPRLAFGRVALVGDAAFVARPHCGIGITKAADDASQLLAALSGTQNIQQALLRYEAERRPFGDRVIAQARRLGSYLDAAADPGGAPAPARDVILRETATIDFLAEAG